MVQQPLEYERTPMSCPQSARQSPLCRQTSARLPHSQILSCCVQREEYNALKRPPSALDLFPFQLGDVLWSFFSSWLPRLFESGPRGPNFSRTEGALNFPHPITLSCGPSRRPKQVPVAHKIVTKGKESRFDIYVRGKPSTFSTGITCFGCTDGACGPLCVRRPPGIKRPAYRPHQRPRSRLCRRITAAIERS